MQTCNPMEWVINPERAPLDSYDHHECPACGEYALFRYVYIDDFDEDFDGDMVYIGEIENGIEEALTPYCPFCGANLQTPN